MFLHRKKSNVVIITYSASRVKLDPNFTKTTCVYIRLNKLSTYCWSSFSPLWKHSGKVQKDRNASDDYTGAATGTSIRKSLVVPPDVIVSLLAVDGGVARGLLWPFPPFVPPSPPAVFFI